MKDKFKRNHLLVALIFTLVGTVLRAQDLSGPVTTIPSASNSKTVYTQLCQNRLNKQKGKPVDIIFIGDSITQQWGGPGKSVWQKYYGDRNAFNFGVGADTTQNVLWRLDNMDIKSFTPKVAVILIGTNNFANKPQDIAAGVKAVVEKTQQVYPGIKIILVSIMPTARLGPTMMATDDIIKGYADNQSIFYLDLVPLMPKENGNWKGLGPDRLHPNTEGYQIWAAAMEPVLAPLLDQTPRT